MSRCSFCAPRVNNVGYCFPPGGTDPIGSIATMTAPDDPDRLRIGDREREQAATLLHEAVGAGYLDLDEFDDRSRRVYAARTRADLRATLADLPTAARLFPPATALLPALSEPDGFGPAETIDVDWTTVKRKGHWSVPARLVITGSMGNADLDLRQASIPPGGCLIDVRATWSTVRIRVGDRTVVRTDHFAGGSMSTLKDKAGPPDAPGGPLVEVRGRPNWTTVVVRR